jgi:hypothetical protein
MEHLTSPKTGEEQRVILSGAHGNLSGASAECTYVRCEIHDDKITAYIRRTQLRWIRFHLQPVDRGGAPRNQRLCCSAAACVRA